MGYFILEVNKESIYNTDTGVVILEIEALNNNNKVIIETFPNDAYDSHMKGLPYYWNNATVWSRNNLTDGVKIHNQDSACYICGPSPTDQWARFLIKTSSNIDTFKIILTNGGKRFPCNIKLLRVSSYNNYNKIKNLDSRSNDNLIMLADINIPLPITVSYYNITIPISDFDTISITDSGVYYNLLNNSIIDNIDTADSVKMNSIKSGDINSYMNNIDILLKYNKKIKVLVLKT